MRTQLNSYLLGGMMIPPMMWMFMLYFSGFYALEQLMDIALSIEMVLFIVIMTSGVLLLFNAKFSTLDNDGVALHVRRSLLNALPYYFLMAQVLYSMVGPVVVQMNQSAIDAASMGLATLAGLPLIFLFVTPLFILFVITLERSYTTISLQDDAPFLSLKMKMMLAIFSTVIGNIVLLNIFNIMLAKSAVTTDVLVVKNITIGLIGLFISAINTVLIVRQIQEPIALLTEALIHEQNNLTHTISVFNRDETGMMTHAYQGFLTTLHATIVQTKALSTDNQARVKELLAIFATMRERFREANVIAQNSSKSAQSIEAITRRSQEDFDESEAQMSQASNELDDAKQAVAQLMQGVQESVERQNELSERLNALSEETSQVKQILTVIGDIAEQTNLLALNAAIEAARAGEHGRGFAVVADEVRKLAERTQRSLTEINATVLVIVQSIIDASEQMRENADVVQNLSHISSRVEEKIDITDATMQTSLSITTKSVAQAREILALISSLMQTSQELTTMQEHNSEAISDVRAIIEQLSAEVKALDAILGEFKTDASL